MQCSAFQQCRGWGGGGGGGGGSLVRFSLSLSLGHCQPEGRRVGGERGQRGGEKRRHWTASHSLCHWAIVQTVSLEALRQLSAIEWSPIQLSLGEGVGGGRRLTPLSLGIASQTVSLEALRA